MFPRFESAGAMAVSSKKNIRRPGNDDVEQIKNDVASFASSLGLASSVPSSGFNDSDFRKSGPMKPIKEAVSEEPQQPQKQKPKHQKQQNQSNKQQPTLETNRNRENQKPFNRRPKPINSRFNNSSENSIGVSNRSFDRFKDLPALPLVKANGLGVWYVDAAELEEKVLGGKRRSRLEIGDAEKWKSLVEKKRELGERLLAQYSRDYEASRGQSAEIRMLLTTQRSGTAADKVSAFSVLVGDNAPANLRSLDALLAMVSSKVGKRHSLTGFEALKELFVQSLLPDRKLKTLFQQPLNLIPETKDGYSLLLFWYWEDCLKQRYERFIAALEEASLDLLPVLKDKAMKTIYFLLKSKAEQEHRLLAALVNKLGAPENKGASNADFYLTNLLSEHPNMKYVVVREVDSFLFRPHLGLRAKYHSVNFLSQIRLGHKGDGPKVAKQLIDVYFLLFKVLISETGYGQKSGDSGKSYAKKPLNKNTESKSFAESHGGLDSRLLSALLTGINRAFPYVSSNEADEIVEVQTPMLFQLVHSSNFNVSIQALMLLDKISSKNQVVSDRYYRALYSKLLLPAAMNSSKEELFIGLLLRTMKNDVNIKRIAAFAKRILQVALQQPPQYTCGCLFLLSEVLKARPPLWHMMVQNELGDDELEHFEDILDESENQTMTGSKELEDKDMVEDNDGSSSHEEHDVDGEEEDEEEAASSSEDDDSDKEEDFFVKEKGMEERSKSGELSDDNGNELSDHNGNQHQESKAKTLLPGGYNPQHREPLYCNADRTSWWELMVLASHVHPSVSTMAKTLLSGASIVYNGNPLNDLCLPAFLDKFMEKKPKQSTWHGASQIEPAKKLEMNDHLIGPKILSLAEADVPPEDLIFHKFYMNKVKSSKKPKKLAKKKKKGGEDEDEEELYVGGDESDNEEIEEMLDAAEPSTVGSDGEYDYDDLDNFDDEEDDLPGGDDDDDDEGGIPMAAGEIDDDVVMEDSDDDGGLKRRKKGKSASPFASFEEYEYLLVDDGDADEGADADEVLSKKKNKKKKMKNHHESPQDEESSKSKKKKKKHHESPQDYESNKKSRPSKKRRGQ